ncbi:small conductance mechanosensitive channel [Natronincola peptidivorans]|uniref:Small conductance mechanosensitive channel n=1 Tax=Natronincola peptidivorans TaxID=426128 RepID=A0A1I0GXW9_9FIRM|nr:mechanosensitive ion channel family protein [Natronincola peptidivorans]SET75336.1 small conductance mechanosensitive channel [Natronincola peptidivorans]
MGTFMNRIETSLQETMEFLRNPEQLTKILGLIINIILILFIAKISIKIIHSVSNRFFQSQKSLKLKVDPARMETMNGLIKSIVKYLIYFIAFTSIIKSFGVEVGALIATAGIGGLAFGFGAQNLVRDVITGFFILFEDQFAVGDYVEIDGVGGIIEEMALRVTKIRDFNGDLHILPNGEIKKVTNKSTGKMRAWVNMSIAYEEDIDKAIQVLTEVSEKLKEENNNILEGPIVLGVTDLGDSDVVISVIAKTEPMEQWATERLMRKSFKQAFDKEGIEIPYPRRVVINKDA